VAALAALAIAWALGAFGGGDEVAVPDVVGMTQEGAAATLADAGLTSGRITRVQSEEDAEGTVVAQSPAAGDEVEEGSAVDLDVAGAPAPTATPVAVPNVVGSSQAGAEAQLTNAGFMVVVSQAESATVPAGTVVSQDPQAGVVAAPGSSVGIVVSTGAPAPTASPSASPSP
jgi:beta-lactam-binding protein with PASTA domain